MYRVSSTVLYCIVYIAHNSATREEARFRKAEWDNYLRHATAPAPKRNTITDSSTASDRCMCSSLEFSRLRSNKVH